MSKLYFKSLRAIVLLLSCSFLILACSASQTTKNYKVNPDGVIEVQPDTMNKDAIRLKGIISSKSKSVSNRYQYEFKVLEVVMSGSTFSTVTPEVEEIVLLMTTQDFKFKNGSEIILDATTPRSRGGEKLMINMVNE